MPVLLRVRRCRITRPRLDPSADLALLIERIAGPSPIASAASHSGYVVAIRPARVSLRPSQQARDFNPALALHAPVHDYRDLHLDEVAAFA